MSTMSRPVRWLDCMLAGLLLGGCADLGNDGENVSVTAAALSACNETVPSDRNVDGIPAYAQCSAAAGSAIYSNNGVDTSLTAMGPDWIKTQYSGGYQCTELAHRYLYFKWQIDWIPRGNAGQWCDSQPPATSGVVQTTTGVHGDVMVLAPGSCGASPSTGHVNVVDTIDAGGRLTAVEQNSAGRRSYMQSCAKCFLHVVANDGSNPGSVMPTGTGGAGAAGASAASVGAGGEPGAGTGGVGAVSGSGGMLAPPMAPLPQAGAAAPPFPPVVPVAPAMPAAAPAAPPAPLPASQMQVGTGGVSAGTGGTTTMSQYSLDVESRRQAQDPGCSVVHAGGGTRGGARFCGLFVFALIAPFARRRARLRSRPGKKKPGHEGNGPDGP